MSTDLHAVQNYDADPDTVFGKFSDRGFLEGRLQAAGGIDPEITELTSTGDGTDRTVKIATKQAIPASAMPTMVASLLPGDPVILRTETWRPTDDGSYRADFDVVIKNAPATLNGTMTLSPADTGKSVLTVQGQASVPIPLFGGKIESVIIEQVGKLLDAEEIYTRKALAG
ncbi:DUF2505 domain-containing protein [Nakamurella lactea]|uniref:DUF2505 domain-containing protein n=1 Tax=Nakamurella lactea TaxID=459515 RepID=UPI000424A829|nr:DUF2505 domain-containing protein [Nakamurella lactea]